MRFLAAALALRLGRLFRVLILKQQSFGKQVRQPLVRKRLLGWLTEMHAALGYLQRIRYSRIRIQISGPNAVVMLRASNPE